MDIAGLLRVDIRVPMGNLDADFNAVEQKTNRFDAKIAGGFRSGQQSAKKFGEEVQGAARKAAVANDNVSGAALRMATSFDTAKASAVGFASAFAVGLVSGAGVAALERLADAATRINNALKVAGLSGGDLTTVYDQLYRSAQRNAAPLESLVELYGRASLVQKELKVSSEDLLRFTDKVSVALRVSGKSAQESSGALLQLSQLLGSGTVRAEEFNSVQEGALPILQAVAAGLTEAGGSVAKLRNLVIDGKVSSEAFFRAFLAGSSTLDARLEGTALAFDQAKTVIRNALTDAVGEFDKTTGASRQLVTAMQAVASAIEDMGGAASKAINGPFGKFYLMVGDLIDRMVQLGADFGAATGLDQVGGNPYIGQRRIQERIDGAFNGVSYTTPKTARLGATSGLPPLSTISIKDHPVTGAAGIDGRAAEQATKAYKDLVASVQERLDQARLEYTLVGQTAAAAEALRVQQDLLCEPNGHGLNLSTKQKNAILDLARACGGHLDEISFKQEISP